MSDSAAKPRPQFRNINITQIARYRLPLAGKVSILHRISGFALFLALPLVLLPLFERSVISEIGFAEFRDFVTHPLAKIVLLGLIWAYLHHFCAGIRFLALDLHLGLEKQKAQRSAGIVLVVSLALTLVFGLKLFGVF
ncbi:succinate dehydrogenase, cytochrome b556 subunit [Pigmentiphaga sp.]|jgi:succinate dehydrogenase, cytochrome b556 subunit|uniref:succinate dehydrogenase, cytochrome b556 subunit n=1 Tax=Pigmentiphaga sp. TaxID=1977564 RepID=UPI0025DDCD80|nr:succinate dehydrogenase, cytochrome b556 subunit [Pigmentiphaga sp.]MBX6319965.1 succinate dehydrogenase, cytochrome b556 subunit [Pigmentiphaga sp.]